MTRYCRILIMLAILLGSMTRIYGNDIATDSSTQQVTEDESNTMNKKSTENKNMEELFETMTNEELEALCTNRGFELVKELDENGKEAQFTRANYIDAARQCLEIEAEM